MWQFDKLNHWPVLTVQDSLRKHLKIEREKSVLATNPKYFAVSQVNVGLSRLQSERSLSRVTGR